MTIDEYADWAAVVANVTERPTNERFSYLGLGLAAEAGEVADVLRSYSATESWITFK